MNQTAQIHNEAIMASAGCGKTEELALRYIRLLAYEKEIDTIMALTFTRAAAGEMRGRILKRLADAVLEESQREQLSQRLKLGRTVTREDYAAWLQRAVEKLHRLRIGTLDSFFVEVIRCFALELGQDSQPDMLDEHAEELFKADALYEIYSRARTDKAFHKELETIFSAITQSADTRNVEDTFRRGIDEGYELYLDAEPGAWTAFPLPGEILSDNEWNDVVEQFYGLEGIGRINNSKGVEYIGREYRELLRNRQWKALLEKGPVGKYIEGKDTYYKWHFDEQDEAIFGLIAGQAEANLILPAMKATAAFKDFLAMYDHNLRNVKSAANRISFSDICRILTGTISTRADADALYVYYRLDGKINHLMIDEFQDTSWDQWQTLEPISNEIISDETGRRTFFMVGDIKQAIYGWRGGDARLFNEIVGYYNGQGTNRIQERPLARSFRSGECILSPVNKIFTWDEDSEIGNELARWRQTTGFTPHTSAVSGARPGYFELRQVSNEESTYADQKRGDRFAAAAEILATIKPWERGISSAVICRRNTDVDEALLALRTKNIPCYSQGKSRMFDDPAVQAVLALIRWADMPGDRLAEFHVKHSFLAEEIPRNIEGATAYLHQFSNQLVYTTYAETLEQLLKPYIGRADMVTRTRLQQLIDLAAAYMPIVTPRPGDFVHYVETSAQREPAASEGVVCTTIHASKGMTYDLVLLPHIDIKNLDRTPLIYTRIERETGRLEKPRIPVVLANPGKSLTQVNALFKEMVSNSEAENTIEYFNTMYVALTRAAKAVYVLYTDTAKNMFSSLMAAALGCEESLQGIIDISNGIPGAVQYRSGNPLWFEAEGILEKGPKGQAYKTVPRVVLEGTAKRHRPYVTPSSMHEIVEGSRSLLFTSPDRAALRRGTALHALMSSIHWLEPAEVVALDTDRHIELVKQVCRESDASEAGQYVKEWLEILTQPVIRAVLTKPEEACEFTCEEPFVTLLNSRIIRGQYDRVVFYPKREQPQRIELYDYKTDALKTEAEISTAVRKYAPQIMVYRQSLCKKYTLAAARVKACILFTAPGCCVEVEDEEAE